MCGIVGYIGKNKKALEVLFNGLESLEYRGYDSAGIAYVYEDELIIKKEVGRIKQLKMSVNLAEKANIGIGHTRWATHGKPTKINSHPHRYKDITIVHNGIIENYQEIKEELIKKKYKFASDTDTEIAAALLYELYKKNSNNMLKAIKLFKEKVIGSYAIAAICSNELDTLYAIKKSSPLIIGIGTDEYYIASDVPAIAKYTNKYITLEDGSYVKLTSDEITVYDASNKVITPKIKSYDLGSETTSKNGYDHYMLKEIHDEPDVIRKTGSIISIPNISNYERIIIVGCGSAMHAGLIGKYLLENYAGIPTDVEMASEFRYKKLFLNDKTLIVGISQSGETADTLEAIKIAKRYGSKTLGIINVKESSIAREVDEVIYTEAGREVAVATTKAYTSQVEVLAMLAYHSRKDKNTLTNFQEDLKKLPIIIDNLLTNDTEYKKIAKIIYSERDIFYIGRSIDYALCMEGALKLKEISYINASAYPAGELKHGTISLIEGGTPVIGIVTDPEIATKTISNLKEVKSRGAFVIYITLDSLVTEGDFYDKIIILPTINIALESLITIVPLQLIAYYTAKLNKCDIDKPKNLAKSVTVE